MGSSIENEAEILSILDEAKDEYVKQAIKLFNDAYMLGRHHAEAAFAEEEEE